MAKTTTLPRTLEDSHALIEEQAKKLSDLQSENERLKYQLEQYARKTYGKSSERLTPDQLLLAFMEIESQRATEESDAGDEEEVEVKRHKRKRRRGGRTKFSDDLPRQRVVANPDSTDCTFCKKPMKQIGEESSEQIHYEPATMTVIETVRPKYACPTCKDGVRCAPPPKTAIPKSKATASTLAHVAVSKYVDHLPLVRQVSMFERQGLFLSKQTLCGWIRQISDMLKPVEREVWASVLSSNVLMADETPVLQYAYDNNHGRLYERFGGATASGDAFEYDWARRLDVAWMGSTQPSSPSTAAYTKKIEYTLDDNGNRSSVKVTPYGQSATTTSYTDNNLNQYTDVGGTTHSYDANGNLTDDGQYTYEYNFRNLLCRVKDGATVVASYQHDALGRRVKTIIGSACKRYIYSGAETIAVYDESNALLQEFVYGQVIDEVLMLEQADVLDADGDSNTTELARSFYHRNALGSIMAITEMDEDVAVSYRYDPYGAVTITRNGSTQSSDPLGQPITYTGRWSDEETGLMYYRARTYSPEIGRFLQRDPLGVGPGPNLYQYVGSRPTCITDPYGLDPEDNTPEENVPKDHFRIHRLVGRTEPVKKTGLLVVPPPPPPSPPVRCMCRVFCKYRVPVFGDVGDAVEYTKEVGVGTCSVRGPATRACQVSCDSERTATESYANTTKSSAGWGTKHSFPPGKPYVKYTSLEGIGGSVVCYKKADCV